METHSLNSSSQKDNKPKSLQNVKELLKKMIAFGIRPSRAKKQLKSQSDFYIKDWKKYNNYTIDYPDSPTGKAYIGIAKKPLMKNKDGYGYQGVLIQDDSRNFVQCSHCGKWAKKITHVHLKKCCGLTTREYKQKYGLNQTTGLISDTTSLNLTRKILPHVKNNFKKGHNYIRSKNQKHSRQFENIYGTCPAQIKDRLKEFIKTNKEYPSYTNRGKTLYWTLVNKFKNANNAYKAFGLPVKRVNTYTFSDGRKITIDALEIEQREFLYKNLLKCELFTKP